MRLILQEWSATDSILGPAFCKTHPVRGVVLRPRAIVKKSMVDLATASVAVEVAAAVFVAGVLLLLLPLLVFMFMADVVVLDIARAKKTQQNRTRRKPMMVVLFRRGREFDVEQEDDDAVGTLAEIAFILF